MRVPVVLKHHLFTDGCRQDDVESPEHRGERSCHGSADILDAMYPLSDARQIRLCSERAKLPTKTASGSGLTMLLIRNQLPLPSQFMSPVTYDVGWRAAHLKPAG